jgi:tol-pal system protein YbgF
VKWSACPAEVLQTKAEIQLQTLTMSTMKPTIYILLTLLTILSGCASQDDVIILDERLALLEVQNSKMKEYSKSLAAKDQNLRSQSAGLRVHIDGLKEEIQLLNGKLEEIDFQIKQTRKVSQESSKMIEARLESINKKTNSYNNRLQHIEQLLDLETPDSGTKLTAVTATKKETGKKKPPSENVLYKQAKQAFDKGDFETAREKFQEYLKQYPKSDNADNAQFWIGEIYYREKWYEKAILEYQKVIENYPKGNKIKASLLKQGYAFYNIGDKSNSRIILKELIKKYPKSNEAKIAKKKLASIK